MGKSFCASPPSSFLSGHAVVQFQSATLFLVEEGKEQVKASQFKKLNINSAQSVVIYSILFLVEECKEQVKASQVKKLNINSAPSAVIYSILRCQMARTRVNTTVLVPESG